MRHISQALLGVFAAVLSSLLVFGSLAMSLAEGGIQIGLLPTMVPTPTQPLPTPRPGEPTYTPSPTATPTATATSAAPTSQCAFPADWVEISAESGDTWESIAQRYQVSASDLRKGNCMTVDWLAPGLVIRVPELVPTATPTGTPTDTPTSTLLYVPVPTKHSPPVQCFRPIGWVIYIVRPGDTLYRLGLAFGIPWQELMRRNCLTSTTIRTGQRIYVPYTPTKTPYPSFTPYPSSTPPPIGTVTSQPPTATAIAPTRTQPPRPTVTVGIPTNTLPAPTPTIPASTNTLPAPTTAVPPTNTPEPLPTTAILPSNTPVPLPTTAAPPSNTPVPLPTFTITPLTTGFSVGNSIHESDPLWQTIREDL
jgi:LysM repeat protein